MICKYPMLRTESLSGNVKFSKCPSDDFLFTERSKVGSLYKRVDWIPCNNCLACRLNYAQDWTARILCELQTYNELNLSSYFVTLTYDDIHLPVVDGCIPYSGEYRKSMTLVKKDVQDFLKRLRYYFDSDIRYFCCGEYGDNSSRPHYHLAIFGLPLSDLKFYKWSGSNALYTSQVLSAIWNKGFVIVGALEPQSASYISKYILKKQKGEKGEEWYESLNIQSEFILASRRPAIGLRYLEKYHESIVNRGYLLFSTVDGAKKYSLPQFFINWLKVNGYPDFIDRYLSFSQSSAYDNELISAESSSLSIYEQIQTKFLNFEQNQKVKRSSI